MSADTLPDSFTALAAPELSDHAARQWDKRMPDGAVAPETGLVDAVSVPQETRRLFQSGQHPVPDDVQLYAGYADGDRYGAVFVINDLPEPVVRTVYRIDSKRSAATRAWCWGYLTEQERGV